MAPPAGACGQNTSGPLPLRTFQQVLCSLTLEGTGGGPGYYTGGGGTIPGGRGYYTGGGGTTLGVGVLYRGAGGTTPGVGVSRFQSYGRGQTSDCLILRSVLLLLQT